MSAPEITVACPHCRQPAAWADNPFRPFCSERCKLIDLSAWADEDYRIPDRLTDPETAENIVEFPKDR